MSDFSQEGAYRVKDTIRLTSCKASGRAMPTDTIPELNRMELRVLEEYDHEHKTFVARCLETGTVASGKDADTAFSLLKEALEFEITIAATKRRFENLWRQPASGDVWQRWHQAAGAEPYDVTETKLTINVMLPTRREVQSEIRIKQATTPKTA